MKIDLDTTDLGRIVHALGVQRELIERKRGTVIGRHLMVEALDTLMQRIRTQVADNMSQDSDEQSE